MSAIGHLRRGGMDASSIAAPLARPRRRPAHVESPSTASTRWSPGTPAHATASNYRRSMGYPLATSTSRQPPTRLPRQRRVCGIRPHLPRASFTSRQTGPTPSTPPSPGSRLLPPPRRRLPSSASLLPRRLGPPSDVTRPELGDDQILRLARFCSANLRSSRRSDPVCTELTLTGGGSATRHFDCYYGYVTRGLAYCTPDFTGEFVVNIFSSAPHLRCASQDAHDRRPRVFYNRAGGPTKIQPVPR